MREDLLSALRLSVTAAARKLGIWPPMAHGILAERHGLMPELALRIEKLCANGPGIWLRLQTAHDLWRVEREMAEEVKRILTPRPPA
ncbi:MAG: HigA family addiction module antitoxin [Acetobacteraceae bacterium]